MHVHEWIRVTFRVHRQPGLRWITLSRRDCRLALKRLRTADLLAPRSMKTVWLVHSSANWFPAGHSFCNCRDNNLVESGSFGQSARSRRQRKTPMQQFHRAVKQVKNMPLHWHDYYGIKCGYFHGIALPEYIYTFVLTCVFAAKACVLSLCRLWMKVICLFCVDLVT